MSDTLSGSFDGSLRSPSSPFSSIDSAEKFRAYMWQLIAAALDVPGIEAASVTDAVPLDSTRSWVIRSEGQPRSQAFGALIKIVGPGLMNTMHTRVVAGREFTDRDDADSVPVALINKTVAGACGRGRIRSCAR